jgi:glycosyltransferase involved in cell wall biosynthesis
VKIVHAIARLNLGGATLSVLELAAAQQRRRHDVVVVAGTLPSREESMEYLADDLEVQVLRLPTLRREVAPHDDVAATYALWKFLRERRPDVLHTHTSKAGATGRLAAFHAGKRRPSAVVHTFHGHVLSGYFPPRRERLYRGIERVLAYTTDKLIAVSVEVREDLVRYGVAPRSKFVVVPYGFDLASRVDTRPETRTRIRADIGADEDTLVVGFIGRLAAVKRPVDLVRAFAAVESEALLAVVGDGEERALAEATAIELGVADRCRFVGYQRDAPGWYAAFDVLLLASANEGTPVAAIEALAAGRPVVATDVGGTATVVDDGETGFLARARDIDALAANLDRLARDRELRTRMGELGAARMVQRFSTARMVADLESVYARAITA